MKKLTITLPENVDEKEIKMTVAAVLFEKGIFTSGQAAEFAEMSKRDFLAKAGKYGVSIFGETIEDLKTKLDG